MVILEVGFLMCDRDLKYRQWNPMSGMRETCDRLFDKRKTHELQEPKPQVSGSTEGASEEFTRQ